MSARHLAGLVTVMLPQAAHAAAFGTPGGVVSPWQVAGSLLFCLALGAAIIALLRKRYGLGHIPLGSTARRLRIIEQQGLGPHRSVALIEVDRRGYLVLLAPSTATLVPLDAPAAMPQAGAK